MTRYHHHPDDTVLSLFASGDLGPTSRWLVGRHVSHCEQCRTAVSAFRLDRDELQREMPVPDINFEAMAHRIRVMADQTRTGTVTGPDRRWKTIAAAGFAVVAVVVALLAPNGGLESPLPQRTAVDIPRPAAQLPVLEPGSEAQVTSQGNLSFRAFHAGSGTMNITEYYAP